MYVRFYGNASDIPDAVWQNTLTDTSGYPFLTREFLTSLEQPDDVNNEPAACCEKTGWQPHHAVVHEGQQALAFMPLYKKYHSYGEYIFDWAWADAYHRHGISYYPKLFCGIPYTPATGPRLAIAATTHSKNAVLLCLSEALKNEAQILGASSIHLLFTDTNTCDAFDALGFCKRASYQYHWFNENPHGARFTDFNDFLDQLKSRKRKSVSKERKTLRESDISITRHSGNAISASLWDTFYAFYQDTYARRSGHGGYLPRHFFHLLGQTLDEKMMLVTASRNGDIIAAALNFYSTDTLYGRYWGCKQDFEFLHFELCYYQGIEFCIERGLHCFDAGAQGEHKIQRGFKATATRSNHWLANSEFSSAIHSYIKEEQALVTKQIQHAHAQSPFKLK